jgi:hypothetical protein
MKRFFFLVEMTDGEILGITYEISQVEEDEALNYARGLKKGHPHAKRVVYAPVEVFFQLLNAGVKANEFFQKDLNGNCSQWLWNKSYDASKSLGVLHSVKVIPEG